MLIAKLLLEAQGMKKFILIGLTACDQQQNKVNDMMSAKWRPLNFSNPANWVNPWEDERTLFHQSWSEPLVLAENPLSWKSVWQYRPQIEGQQLEFVNAIPINNFFDLYLQVVAATLQFYFCSHRHD